MKRFNFSWATCACVGVFTILLAAGLSGCASSPPTTQATAPAAAAAITLPTIRIKAGIDEPLKDSKGTTWAADTGFDGGESVDRPELEITGTDRPELYHSERYSMNAYSIKSPTAAIS